MPTARDSSSGTRTRSPGPRAEGNLLQVLGVSFGVAVLIGNTILVGILRTPGDVAARLPSPALFLGVWILGGLFTPCSATLSLAEPGAMLAQSGRPVRHRPPRARRRIPAFVVGWTDWISTCGTIALGAMVFTEYLEPLVPAMAGRRVPGGRGAGAPLRPPALARHPDRRPLAADPERAQGAGLRTADRRLPALAPLPRPEAVAPAALPAGSPWSRAIVLAAPGGDLHLRRLDRAALLRRGGAERRPGHPAGHGDRRPPRHPDLRAASTSRSSACSASAGWRAIRSSPRPRARPCSARGATWSSGCWCCSRS